MRLVYHVSKYGPEVNDIALLRLDTSPYNLERRAAAGHPTTPVPLCPAALQPEGRKCRVSGWGHLKSKGSGVPDKLREVEVKVRGWPGGWWVTMTGEAPAYYGLLLVEGAY